MAVQEHGADHLVGIAAVGEVNGFAKAFCRSHYCLGIGTCYILKAVFVQL